MSTGTLRVASIGVGGMSGTHAKLFAANPRVELVCVCDIVEAKAKQRGQELGCDAVTDYHDVLGRTDVDAVMVGIPNVFHTRSPWTACAPANTRQWSTPSVRRWPSSTRCARKRAPWTWWLPTC